MKTKWVPYQGQWAVRVELTGPEESVSTGSVVQVTNRSGEIKAVTLDTMVAPETWLVNEPTRPLRGGQWGRGRARDAMVKPVLTPAELEAAVMGVVVEAIDPGTGRRSRLPGT